MGEGGWLYRNDFPFERESLFAFPVFFAP